MRYKNSLNDNVITNFSNIKLWYLAAPLSVLFLFFCFFVIMDHDHQNIQYYIAIQKNLFIYLNQHLSHYKILETNITQLGDALIAFPLLTIFILYAPRLWEAIITSSLISLGICALLKKLFGVPRPAAALDHDCFVIIGKTLSGKTSTPSGHSIATFIFITVLLYALMPQKNKLKILWSFGIVAIGLLIASSRIGVGAHYPLDVVIGCIIGFCIGIVGIKISNNVNWLRAIGHTKYHIIHLLMLFIWIVLIVFKILEDNLLIYYISIIALLVTSSIILRSYVKKNQ
jgi:membrane-associated phospholipid phosphatase